jgi:hypothetical protein
MSANTAWEDALVPRAELVSAVSAERHRSAARVLLGRIHHSAAAERERAAAARGLLDKPCPRSTAAFVEGRAACGWPPAPWLACFCNRADADRAGAPRRYERWPWGTQPIREHQAWAAGRLAAVLTAAVVAAARTHQATEDRRRTVAQIPA